MYLAFMIPGTDISLGKLYGHVGYLKDNSSMKIIV